MELDPFARKLMAQYLRRRERDLESLATLLRQSDFESIREIGHKLYGSGSTYGLDEVSRIGGELESAAKSGSSDEVEQVVDRLKSYLQGLSFP